MMVFYSEPHSPFRAEGRENIRRARPYFPIGGGGITTSVVQMS